MGIKKFIPNSITSMNLLCGSVGVIFTLEGRSDIAFLLMIAAAVFDFCDGLSARLLKAYSDIGKELDSLSDMVSFGLLPSLMLYKTMPQECGQLRYVPLFIAVMSALRLAKFNLDERQHDSFLGLPTPACAMVCGALTYYVVTSPLSALASLAASCWFIPALSIILGLLLVSEIPMFSFKFGKGLKADKATTIKRLLFVAIALAAAVLTLVLHKNWSLIPLAVFPGYILENLMLLPLNHKN